MTDIKTIVAKNISELRVANKLTQLELAEKLNYSDKAVSKWERGDSMPDISVLVSIADLFGVPLDYLIREDHQPQEAQFEYKRQPRYSRAVIALVSLIGVCSVALLAFVLISILAPETTHQWLCFIYAIPVISVVWLILNSIWFNKKRNYLIISILMWSLLLSLHISFLLSHINIWMVYLLGIPGQIIILLCSFMKRKTKN